MLRAFSELIFLPSEFKKKFGTGYILEKLSEGTFFHKAHSAFRTPLVTHFSETDNKKPDKDNIIDNSTLSR